MSMPESPTPSRPSHLVSLLQTVGFATSNGEADYLTAEFDDILAEAVGTVARPRIEAPIEKAKASKSYGLSTIHYGLILPLKQLTVGLTKEQATNLDIYRKHKALTSGIAKVQKTFKTYSAAHEAVENAPTTNQPHAREGARRTEMKAAKELVSSYDDLIKLAVEQAAELDFNQSEQSKFVEDLHKTLDVKTKGLILKIVNELRPRRAVEDGLLNNKKISSVQLRTSYLNFVTDFVGQVQAASRQSANQAESQAISKAFVNGLATIPELGDLKDGLILIEYYDALTEMQKNVNDDQSLVIRNLVIQLEKLLNGTEEITAEDLENIQSKGISLQMIVPSINVDELNAIRDLRRQLQDVEAKIEVCEAELSQKRLFLEEGIPYRLNDVETFLTEMDASRTKKTPLNEFPKDETPTGRLAKAYAERREQVDLITQRIQLVEQEERARHEAFEQAHGPESLATGAAAVEIIRLGGVITQQTREITDLESELAQYEAEYTIKMKERQNPKTPKLNALQLKAFTDLYNAEHKGLEDRMDAALISLTENHRAEEAQKRIWETSNSRMLRMTSEDCCAELVSQERLTSLRAELEAVKKAPLVNLTGEDILAITESLTVLVSPDAPQSVIAQKLKASVDAAIRGNALTSELSDLRSNAAALTAQMRQPGAMITLNARNGFNVNNDQVFGNDQKVQIANLLQSNLVIAKKVTMAIGREIVSQNQKQLKKEADLDTKRSHKSKRAFTDAESKLGRLLEDREKQDANKKDVHTLVQERVDLLPIVVRPGIRPSPVVVSSSVSNTEQFEFEDSDDEESYDSRVAMASGANSEASDVEDDEWLTDGVFVVSTPSRLAGVGKNDNNTVVDLSQVTLASGTKEESPATPAEAVTAGDGHVTDVDSEEL